jgi:hypothetical protein
MIGASKKITNDVDTSADTIQTKLRSGTGRPSPASHVAHESESEALKRLDDDANLARLKCNRSLPCDTCNRRNNQGLCHYASNADRQDKRADRNESVADRLKNLESLITTAAQNTQTSNPTTSTYNSKKGSQKQPSSDNIPLSGGSRPEAVVSTADTAPSGLVGQVDSSHWSSMLENIRAIRDDLPAESPHTSTISSTTLNNDVLTNEANFDMGSPDGLTLEHILSAVPPRQVCDTLVSVFFLSHYTMMRELV